GVAPDLLGWWTLMQHHGAPTRLLDWTASAFVAAYFACETDRRDDGAVWVLDSHALAERVTQVFGVSFPSANEFAPRCLDRMAVRAVWVISRPRATERIVAQQGVFTVAEQILTDHDTELTRLANGNDDVFFRIVIPSVLKKPFLRRLRRLNISAGT